MTNKHQWSPPWVEKVPEPGTFRSIFKWGAGDTFKHPNPGFLQIIAKELGLVEGDFKQPAFLGEKIVENRPCISFSQKDAALFESIVGPENCFSDTYARLKSATGKSMEDILNLRAGKTQNIPDLVLHPKNRADIEKIVRLCHEKKIPLHVTAGGSSVTQGLACPKGGVTLVMTTHMTRVLEFNETNQTITVEPGLMGPAYEDMLNQAREIFNAERPYTGGHFPQSFEFSSVGGWVVTLGSGQASSYYGDAGDLVVAQDYVTPTGDFKTLDFPATATGPKINDIMKGSEGCFGVLTALTLKIFPYFPEAVRPFAFMFRTFADAIFAVRQISRSGCGMPSVLRVSDPEETDIAMKMYGLEGTLPDRFMSLKGLKPGSRCLVMGRTEGEPSFSKNLFRQVKKIGKSNKGLYLTGYPMKKWQAGRFSDPYMRDSLNDFGVLIDTLEAAVTWDHVEDLYKGVRSHVKKTPGMILMTHASHFYTQGTNLYFIFITKMMTLDEFKAFQTGVIEKITALHGSLSHHHGVGRMLAPFLETHLGKKQMDVLRALKREFDPHNIMNPGALGLGRQ
ncbi:MAG: oxidoreductase [Desulfobacterales bacterium RIFOXYA12_FULL_46_15]|nr:MAG: oxidoreductase [Desulfobacterales bacterium RIFOXYA12_FULL_46_15]